MRIKKYRNTKSMQSLQYLFSLNSNSTAKSQKKNEKCRELNCQQSSSSQQHVGPTTALARTFLQLVLQKGGSKRVKTIEISDNKSSWLTQHWRIRQSPYFNIFLSCGSNIFLCFWFGVCIITICFISSIIIIAFLSLKEQVFPIKKVHVIRTYHR